MRIQENLENSDQVGRLSRALEAGARRQRCVWGAAEPGEVLGLANPTGSGRGLLIIGFQFSGLQSSLTAEEKVRDLPVCLFSAPPLGSLPASMPLNSRPLSPLTECLVQTLFDTRLDTFNIAALYTHSIHFPCSSVFDPRLWPHGPVPEFPNAPESITDTEPVLQRQAIPDASSMTRHAAGPCGTGRAPPLVSNTSRQARPLQDFDSDRPCVISSLGMIKEHDKQGPATTHLPRKP